MKAINVTLQKQLHCICISDALKTHSYNFSVLLPHVRKLSPTYSLIPVLNELARSSLHQNNFGVSTIDALGKYVIH